MALDEWQTGVVAPESKSRETRLRYLHVCLGLLGILAMHPAHTRSRAAAQIQDAEALPSPNSEWQLLGYYPSDEQPYQAMLIGIDPTGSKEERKVDLIFIFSPPQPQGADRMFNRYTVNCLDRTIRDDRGGAWYGSRFLGSVISETDDKFLPSPPDSIFSGIIAYGCDKRPKLGPPERRDAAIASAFSKLKAAKLGSKLQ